MIFFRSSSTPGFGTSPNIEWLQEELDCQSSRRALEASRRVRNARDFGAVPGTTAEKEKLLNALFVDAATAGALGHPFSFDASIKPFAQWTMQQRLAALGSDPRLAIYKRWVAVRVPDFSRATWSDLHDMRESAAGRDFRAVLARVSDRLAEALPDLQTDEDVRVMIDSEFLREATADLTARVPVLQRVARAVAIDISVSVCSDCQSPHRPASPQLPSS